MSGTADTGHPPFEEERGYTSVGTPVTVGEVDDPAVKALLLQFENLGVNCEFGLVQRRYAAEPLGLLRWSYTPPATLVMLLEDTFAGVGDPATTRLFEVPWGELTLHDTRYGFRLHTFVLGQGVDRPTFLAAQCRRLAYLADKLRRDLVNGEKILVYAAPTLQPGDDERIHQLLRRYGNNAVLIIKLAEPGNPPGAVFQRRDGLYIGYVRRFGLTTRPDGPDIWDIDFDTWVTLCRKVMTTGRRFLPPP